MLTATYTQDGIIYVGGSVIATHDAAGSPWIRDVDRKLRAHGYRRLGPWSLDVLGDSFVAVEDTD